MKKLCNNYRDKLVFIKIKIILHRLPLQAPYISDAYVVYTKHTKDLAQRI